MCSPIKGALIFAIIIVAACSPVSPRTQQSNSDELHAVVRNVYRPTFYFGALESWIKVVVDVKGEEKELFLMNRSAVQVVPMVNQHCEFHVAPGLVMDAAGDENLTAPRTANLIMKFTCE